MKFYNCHDARVFATLERVKTGRRHIVMPTRHWSMSTGGYRRGEHNEKTFRPNRAIRP